MASETPLDGMAKPTRPITIAGRTDIAKVVFTDGHSINFPSIASVASASPTATTPSTFCSRSSSQRRERRCHGGSFSSESSARDSFSLVSLPSIGDATDPDSALTAVACSATDGIYQPLSDLDLAEPDLDWGTQTLRPRELWDTDLASSNSIRNQDHLVAAAEGASLSLPPHWQHTSKTFDDLLEPSTPTDSDEGLAEQSTFATFAGPQSAPEPLSWIDYARSADDARFSTMTAAPAAGPSIDLMATGSVKASRKPGRARGSKLPEEKRQKVAKMRKVGACKYCKDGRRGCDPGTPCKPCIQHFGSTVLEQPNHCRKDIIADLCGQILSPVCKWHPHPRALSDFFGRDFRVTDWCYDVPIQFGFGPCLRCPVLVVTTSQASLLRHQHVAYSSPLSTRPESSQDFVLPVTFQDPSRLYSMIDQHLSMLVDEHFGQFTIFDSNLHILDKILKLYHHFRHTSEEYASLVRQALKFLVLVHNSEITIADKDVSVTHILSSFAPGYSFGLKITPCILRAELGKAMPELAHIILEDVLRRLLKICLARSIMYHSSRIGYHANAALPGLGSNAPTSHGGRVVQHNPFESIAHPVEATEAIRKLESAAWDLQTIYRNCFENCHALLLRIIEERHFMSVQKQFGDVPARFIVALNQAIREAGGYLESQVSGKFERPNERSSPFDRLLARLFLLQSGPF
ncbi:MAG: hypothetical protein Q9162_007885 [Coniocarpon cinnabarinum]